ncbi:MAG: hypothetical protein JO180_05210 [Gemmatirosa sp.]|nr:hypothetical protein [Gemmatirosa sp.]
MRNWTRAARLALTTALCLAAPAACARQVEVRTGESPSAVSTSIEFTNKLTQAVNVYVRPNGGGSEIFVRQVAGGGKETMTVRGVAPGTAVTLRAAPVDGSVSYTKENVVLGQGYAWQVP